MAAQALDELSRLAPAASLADGIPAEAPVPVVEMKSFESLDSIANQLAAGPGPKHDNLNDLASLFAATPAPRRPEPLGAAFEAPRPAAETPGFESLFATPAPAASAAPIAVPGIDPSLFAVASAHALTADPLAHAPLAEPASVESLFVPRAAEYAEIAAAPVTFEEPDPIFAAPITFEEPDPIFAAPVTFEEPDPIFAAPVTFEEPEPIVVEPALVAPPVSVEAVPVAQPQSEAVATAPVYDEPVRAEAVLADATVPEAVLAEFELPEPEPAFVEAAPPKSKLFESIPAVVTPEPAVAVQTEANAVAWEFDEEIALDVDAFDAPAVAPAAAARPVRPTRASPSPSWRASATRGAISRCRAGPRSRRPPRLPRPPAARIGSPPRRNPPRTPPKPSSPPRSSTTKRCR